MASAWSVLVLVKPATTRTSSSRSSASRPTPHKKRLLVIEDNDIERDSIVELVRHDDIDIAAVGTGQRR